MCDSIFRDSSERQHWFINLVLRDVQKGSMSYLAQRFELGLHDELILAQLTAASVGALDPLL